MCQPLYIYIYIYIKDGYLLSNIDFTNELK